MTLFGEYLNQMIQSRDISISRLARDSGVERTAIHKAMSGDRILPYHAVESLAYCLKLSPGESGKLHQFYDRLFESENTGRAREIVEGAFRRISDLHLSAREEGHPAGPRPGPQSCYWQERSVYRGFAQVARLIRSLLEEEAKTGGSGIEAALPPDMPVWKDSMGRLYEGLVSTGMRLSHIVCLDASAAEGEYNLQNLETLGLLLPGCVLAGQRYRIYYYYSDTGQIQYTDPLPYFLVTRDKAVCLSRDYDTAICFREREQVEYFHACFLRLKKACYQLNTCREDREAAEEDFREAVRKGRCVIMSRAYFGNPEMNREKDWTLLLTGKGIRDFLETGRFYDPFTGTARVADRWGRGGLLQDFFEALGEGRIKGGILDEEKSAFPKGLALSASADSTMFLWDKGEGACVREGDLCRAIRDWCIHLSGSRHVYDREEAEILTRKAGLWQSG